VSDSLNAFIRHARLYGAECVYETASSNGFSERELALLRVALDAIERNRKNGRYTTGHQRRRSPEETIRTVRLLCDGGLVAAAIADKLGISDNYVRKCLRKSETAEKGAVNPHG
jgi:DNA invertase Pin-like site-specific DNA recombinase